MKNFDKENFAQGVTDAFWTSLRNKSKKAFENGDYDMSDELIKILNDFYDKVENNMLHEFGRY